MDFLKSRPARVLTILLLGQAAIFYGMSRGEAVQPNTPLSQAPHRFGSWLLHSEGVVEKEVQDVLKADELLTRTYTSPEYGVGAHLFVAYFRSQRTGQAPHSPKNCLPGSGWIPTVSDDLHIPIPGRAEPITVNRYVVQKGDTKSLVMYWYQSRDRVVASEYKAKAYVIADALRYNRTDTALVRVVVPINGNDIKQSEAAAFNFVQSFFAPLRKHFPA